MKVIKYKFSQEFTYHGLGRWLTSYGIVEPGETPEEAAQKLMQQSSEIIKQAIKEQAEATPVIQQEKKLTGLSGEAKIIADIYTVIDIKVLETYKLMVKGKPAMEAAYEEMKIKLAK